MTGIIILCEPHLLYVPASVSAKVSGGFWGQNYEVSGSVSTKSENTRSSDSSAKYTINAKAKQMDQSEGMAKMVQIMASTIEPLPIGGQ